MVISTHSVRRLLQALSTSLSTSFRTALALAGCFLAGPAGAVIFDVGPADVLAIDQPRITFGLTDESSTPATLIGPQLPGLALLDTGANGVLLSDLAYRNEIGGDVDFGQPVFPFDYDGNGTIDADEQLAQYAEQGVAGFSLLDVHDAHGLRITDTDGVQRLVGTDIRAFGDSGLSLGSFNAIVGMPAMAGYVVEVDMRPSLGFDFQRVAFHDTPGEATFESAASMDIALRIVPPEFTDTTLPENIRPTFAGLPVIDNVDMKHTGGANSPGGKQTANDYTFLVDTGAQTLIISEQMATDLGIDFLNTIDDVVPGDVIDFLEVGGIGGTALMPIVNIDEFLMPTADGNEILWTNINAGVLDIEGAPFDAVLGMNMLTTGYFNEVFLGQPDEHVFDKVVFDFTPTDGSATMRLDFFDTPVEVPEPGTLMLIAAAGIAVTGRRRRAA